MEIPGGAAGGSCNVLCGNWIASAAERFFNEGETGGMRRILAAFRADVVQGILKRWYVYALAVLAAVLFALDSRIQLKPIMERPGTLDLLAFMLRGAEKYIPGLQQNRFELSYGYLTIFGLLGLASGQYAARAWKERGRVYLLYYGRKSIWWIGKCIWNFCNIVLIYILLFLSVWTVAAVGGNAGMEIGPELEAASWWSLHPDRAALLLYIMGSGIITMTALSQFQMTLQILFVPVLGFLVYMAVLISSVYCLSPFLMGNSLMLLRTQLCTPDGVSFGQTVVVGICVWGFSVAAGALGIRKKDVL